MLKMMAITLLSISISSFAWGHTPPTCRANHTEVQAIKGYITLDVQGSASIAREILGLIDQAKKLDESNSITVTGNAYTLTLKKDVAELENDYESMKTVPLCALETFLIKHIRELEGKSIPLEL